MILDPKVLIVEDDDFFRKTLSDSLRRASFDVTEAPNGKVAKDLLELSTFDLIISDIQMPFLTGIELLEWSKAHSPTKFVLMTGFSQILETKRAHELGADDFIAKPFSAVQLLDVVKKHLRDTKKETQAEKVDLDKHFCKVSLEDFISSKETVCSIFIRMSNTKYIRISHKGGKLSDERVKSYKEKGVQFVYVHQDDFPEIVGFNLKIARILTDSDQVSNDKKIRFMSNASEMILESVALKGIDQKTFNDAKSFLETSLDVVTKDSSAFDVLSLMQSHSDQLYAHGLAVSTISILIAKEMGWTAPPTLFKLAMGGLFHDVGKKEIDPALLAKARALLSRDERSLIESHCVRSKEILETLRTMPSEVVQIAYQHHEDLAGEGYPRRISKNDIHPLAKVVHVANLFCELVMPSQAGATVYQPVQAVQYLREHKGSNLDKDPLIALGRVFSKKLI